MLRIERQAKILHMIRERGYVENRELAKAFGVTLATIRSDLKALSEQKLVRLDHGGTTLWDLPDDLTEPSYETKSFIAHEIKREIGVAAVSLLHDGDTLILDSGTTNAQIARSLHMSHLKNLTVITCDIMVAKELGQEQNMNVIVLGGQLRKSYYSTYGPYTEYVIRNLRANKFFLGIDAANIDGITNIVLEEVPIKQLMIEISEEVILVANSTKFDRSAPHRVCSWEPIDRVISDTRLPQPYLDLFGAHNIALQTVRYCEDLP